MVLWPALIQRLSSSIKTIGCKKKEGLKHETSIDLFDVEVEPEHLDTQCDTHSASHAAPAEVVAALNDSNMQKE